MFLFDPVDPQGTISLPEIRKTGANSVRIVWGITQNAERGGTPTDPAVLDTLITAAKQNRMIPMIELHDATGQWDRLPDLVNYWVQPQIVNIIQQHQKYLLVNIGNEVGGSDPNSDGTIPDQNVFVSSYTNAIQTMRAAGIHTPLVIDAPNFGKDLDMLNKTAATLLKADPDKNLIFSVHTYWSILHEGADANFINTKLKNAVALNYPLIVGEFSQWGAYNQGQDICSGGGEVDYQAILQACATYEIGWYAWEWGPGNGYVPGTDPPRYDGPCQVMDMTPDRLFVNLKPGWAKEVAISSPYSIKNSSETYL
jgi:mannan endo-1,4-beta-mannosidase